MDGLDTSERPTAPGSRDATTVDRALEALRQNRWIGYGFAAAASLLTLGARLAANGLMSPNDYPFLSFLPAVVVATYLAGLGPGILCAVLGGLASWYFFIPPLNTFVIDRVALVGLAFYGVVVAVDITLIHLLTRTAGRLRDAQRMAGSLYQQQKTMFQELQHRVANNMAFVASMLEMQKRKAADHPETAAAALEEAIARIHVMARIHRRLYDPALGRLSAGDILGELCGDLLDVADARGVTYVIEAQDVAIDITRMITLALLTAELVTNSLKHAFPDDRPGVVTVRLREHPPGSLALEVADNGRGLPSGDAPAATGLGRRIIERLAQQLGGNLTLTSDGGVTARVSFPV